LGFAGVSFSMASCACAVIGQANANTPPQQTHEIFLSEEEISDVSLATFHVFNRENAGTHGARGRLAMGVGGCAGCGGCGCACGTGLYYHYTPPLLGDPVDPPPRSIRPANKHKSHGATR
jgi:hypothetical protein